MYAIYKYRRRESVLANSLRGQSPEMKQNPSTFMVPNHTNPWKVLQNGALARVFLCVVGINHILQDLMPSSSQQTKQHFVGSRSQPSQTSLEFRSQRQATVQ